MNATDIIRSLFQAQLELQDDRLIEQLWFTEDSRVAATLGEKNGPTCGPMLSYRVENETTVVISDHSGDLSYIWTDLVLTGDTLTVQCARHTKVFKIKRPKKARSRHP